MIQNKALVKKLNKSGEVIKKVNTSQFGYSRKNLNSSQIISEINSMTQSFAFGADTQMKPQSKPRGKMTAYSPPGAPVIGNKMTYSTM
jgi:hypothetical protein